MIQFWAMWKIPLRWISTKNLECFRGMELQTSTKNMEFPFWGRTDEYALRNFSRMHYLARPGDLSLINFIDPPCCKSFRLGFVADLYLHYLYQTVKLTALGCLIIMFILVRIFYILVLSTSLATLFLYPHQ